MHPIEKTKPFFSNADGDPHENVQHHWMHDALIIKVSSSKVQWGLVGIPFELVTLEGICEKKNDSTTVYGAHWKDIR